MMKPTLIALAALALAGPAAAKTESFKDWQVVCDNVRVCTAFGFSPEGGETVAYLKIVRGAGPLDAPRVTLAAYADGESQWRLAIDGRPVPGIAALRARRDGDDANQRASLTEPQATALLQAARNGAKLTLTGGPEPFAISLAGSAAALRWMDEQQWRADTQTGLVARGAKPPAAMPVAPQPPLLRAGPAVSQAGLPGPPAALLKANADCDDDIAQAGVETEIARLSPGTIFWGVPCSRGAYNIVYNLFLSDERGGGLRPLSLAQEPGGKAFGDLMNISFNAKTQTLSNFDKARGIADCGAMGEWLWDGKAFQPKSLMLMPACRGVPAEDWPADYVTRAK